MNAKNCKSDSEQPQNSGSNKSKLGSDHSPKKKSPETTLEEIDQWFLDNGFTDSTEEMIGKASIIIRTQRDTD